MIRKFMCLSYFYFVFFFIVGGISVTVRNNNPAHRHIGSTDVTRETLFINTVKTKTNLTISDTQKIRRASNLTKFDTKSRSRSTRNKTESVLEKVSNGRKNNTLKLRDKDASFLENFKNAAVNKSRREMQKFIPTSRSRDKITDTNIKRRKLIDVLKQQRVKSSKRKKVRVSQDPLTETIIPVQDYRQYEYLDVPCKKSFFNETSMSLRNLFRLPRLKKATDCSIRRNGINGIQRNPSFGQSSVSSPRLSDKGHTELINQYEKEQSMDEMAGEYVHPEGHDLDGHFPRNPYSIKNDENYGVMKGNDTSNRVIGNEAGMKIHENDYYASSKYKRDIKTILAYHVKSSRAERNENLKRQRAAMEKKFFSKGAGTKNLQYSRDVITQISAKPMLNSTSQMYMELQLTTETPWPLVPGPISCDLDFQLQPSFVAKLGEFDYVVSVQLQRNPDEPADHACTGVIYNPRFVVIAPHCLHDNYGVTVTSTDDLCTIDEMIEVDYIIEHENYDAETRRHDIALIKLKSEIHKRSAKFPKEDGALGRNFYAVGFGELMWRSFPKKISKLLQKLPVRRYPRVMKEVPGTLHITTSHMDLTGAFRGDFGGALINPRGEFVGLKSKLVKKSTEYEVYTRVRSYLPWIQSMVALHGS